MIESQSEEGGQIRQQLFLIKQLQKFLNLQPDHEQSQLQMKVELMANSEQLFMEVQQLLQFCNILITSVEAAKKSTLFLDSQVPAEMPRLVVKQINNVRLTREVEIVNVANKLKALVCKTMQKESSRLRYNFTSFTSQIDEQINGFNFDNTVKNMCDEMVDIRKRFRVVPSFAIPKYKLSSSPALTNRVADFYVSFYNESLLFFLDNPLPFNRNLLFVPLLHGRQINKDKDKVFYSLIEEWYIQELYREHINWESFALEIIINRNKDNSVKSYAFLGFQKKGHEDYVCAQLRKIRCFVYLSMLFNYMSHSLVLPTVGAMRRKIEIRLNEKYTMTVTTESHHKSEQVVSDPGLAKKFLAYFEESRLQQRKQTSKEQATNYFQNYMILILSRRVKDQLSNDLINMAPKYVYKGDKRVRV